MDASITRSIINWKKANVQEMLESLAAQELFASEIAAKMTVFFGAEFTRNAVIGRARRTNVKLNQQTKFERSGKKCGERLTDWSANAQNQAYRVRMLRKAKHGKFA